MARIPETAARAAEAMTGVKAAASAPSLSIPSAFYFPEGLDFEGSERLLSYLRDHEHQISIFMSSPTGRPGVCVLRSAKAMLANSAPVPTVMASSRRANMLMQAQNVQMTAHVQESLMDKARGLGLSVVTLDRLRHLVEAVILSSKQESGRNSANTHKSRSTSHLDVCPRIVIKDRLRYPTIERVSLFFASENKKNVSSHPLILLLG